MSDLYSTLDSKSLYFGKKNSKDVIIEADDGLKIKHKDNEILTLTHNEAGPSVQLVWCATW